MSLGIARVAGKSNNIFDQPSNVFIALNGDIFVADGHSSNGNNRIVKYNSAGEYLMQWGGIGTGPGQKWLSGCFENTCHVNDESH